MIDLPPDLQKAVSRHIASGNFSNAEDVLRAAIKNLDALNIESLKQSVADERAGRTKVLSDVAEDLRGELGFPDSE